MSLYQIQTISYKAAPVNPNVTNTLLAGGLSTFLIKGKPAFSNGPRSLPKTPPDLLILCN